MSASLVGSEMCIRDSNRGALVGPSIGLTRQLPTIAPRAAIVAIASVCGPVSYTHLTLPTICSV
eukprot:12616384-Alexandrium_andersonii.AAC.1